jgi:putative ABC transport system substrate-binding protein
MFEYSLCGKWPALLKEIAPRTTRAAVLRDPAVPAGIGQFAVIQSVAGSVGLDVIPINLSDAAEFERELADFAQSGNGGLILTAGALSSVHRDLIITLAARHKRPRYIRSALLTGDLIFTANFLDQHRRAAGYVDRILKGESRPTRRAGADKIRAA